MTTNKFKFMSGVALTSLQSSLKKVDP